NKTSSCCNVLVRLLVRFSLFNLEGANRASPVQPIQKPNEVGFELRGGATEGMSFRVGTEANDPKFATTRANSSAG
ncbi:hypothetical protein, partial [Pseudoflavonifractor capillosus]|uniref:hypothetical protein n=1 Tax=Pseudoflavonifractor capillosus TaxID=106588 RepID=UPI00195814E1